MTLCLFGVNILPPSLTPYIEEHGSILAYPIIRKNVIATEYSMSEDGSFSIEFSSECLNECVLGVWGYDEGERVTLLDALKVE